MFKENKSISYDEFAKSNAVNCSDLFVFVSALLDILDIVQVPSKGRKHKSTIPKYIRNPICK